MELTLRRIAKRPTYTIGRLYINGVKFCDTLEDRDRGLTQDMPLEDIKKIKVPNKTAIPAGTYPITMNIISPRLSRQIFYRQNCDGGRVPRLLNVPGYDGILMHVGNTAAHSSGCILVGENNKVGMVLNSKDTFLKLYKLLKQAALKGEKITITIK